MKTEAVKLANFGITFGNKKSAITIDGNLYMENKKKLVSDYRNNKFDKEKLIEKLSELEKNTFTNATSRGKSKPNLLKRLLHIK